MNVHLTDTERVTIHDAIAAWFNDGGWPHNLNDHVCPAVERLIAARLAEQREAIATAIERLPLSDGGWPVGEYDMRCNAATLVREYQPGEES